MSISPPPTVSPPTGGIFPTPPISRGGARAAILSRLAAQGRSPDFLDDGAISRLIDHARGSPRTLRAALDATLAVAAREGARRGDAALVGRALDTTQAPRTIVTARTRRALWLAGSGFAAASVLLIFLAPLHPARVALVPAAVSPAGEIARSAELADVPAVEVAPTPRTSETPVERPAPAPTPAQPAEASPQLSPVAGDAPLPARSPTVPPIPTSVEPAAAQPRLPQAAPNVPPPAQPTPVQTEPVHAAPPQTATIPAMPQPQPQPQPAPAPAAVPPLAPDVGVAAPPVPAAPIAVEPPTALVLYAAGAPGVQQRLNSLSTRLRQAGIGQIEKRAVPAGTALGRPVSFFDRGDLALAQRAAGVLASEGWPNLPVDELAPRMIRPRAAWRQHHVVIEIQLP